MTNYKLVVVGDGNIGKTCLLLSYVKNEFPKDYVPTVFDNYLSDVSCGNQLHKVVLWDTAGQEDFDRLRPLSYPDTDVIVLCYAVNLRNSFENIVLKWIPEIKLHLKEVPIILVATKVDLRVNDINSQMVTFEEGKKLRRQIRAMKFFECSSLTRENVSQVFEEAVESVVNPQSYKSDKLCCQLF